MPTCWPSSRPEVASPKPSIQLPKDEWWRTIAKRAPGGVESGDDHAFRKANRKPDPFPAGPPSPDLDSTVLGGVVARADVAPARRGLGAISGGRTAADSCRPSAALRVWERPARVSGLAPDHALRQLPVYHPARPQRPVRAHGSSATLLERSLHAWIGMDAIHPGGGSHGVGQAEPICGGNLR